MKRRIALAIVVLSVILGGLVVVVAFRVQQVPSLLTIFVTFNYLSRERDQSYAGQAFVTMDLTATNETNDNVTLVSTVGYDNLTTDAYWRLQIVLNESTTTVAPWEHDIGLGNDTAGQYGGTVSKSFVDLNGNFTIWIVLWSMYGTQATRTVISSQSELIQIY